MTQPVHVDVLTSDLLRAFRDVRPFACTDGTFPMINAVAFEFAGDDLLLITTDRYTLGVTRIPVQQSIVQPPRMVAMVNVDKIERTFRAPKGSDPMLALQFGAEGLAVETTATLDGEPTLRLACPWLDAEPVKWRAILDQPVSSADMGAAFNPAYLAKFAHLARFNEPVQLTPSGNKAWPVTVGDHFIGLIMPMRPPANASNWSPQERNEAPAPSVRKRTPRPKKAAA